MKIRLSRFGTLLFAALMLVSARAAADPGNGQVDAARAARTCITNESELAQAPKVKTVVDALGGVRALQGQWQLGGFAGNFKQVTVVFQSRADGFKGKVIGLDSSDPNQAFSNVTACSTSTPGTLKLIVKRSNGKTEEIFIRRGANGTLELAQNQPGQQPQFYTFNRVGTAPGGRSVASVPATAKPGRR